MNLEKVVNGKTFLDPFNLNLTLIDLARNKLSLGKKRITLIVKRTHLKTKYSIKKTRDLL